MSAPAAPVQPTRVARASAWIALAALITGLAFAPPWHVPSDVPPGFAARLAGGALERLADREWVAVGVGELLADGTSVRAPDGIARLNVDGGRIELGDTTRAVLRAERAALESGGILVDVGRRSYEVRLGALGTTGRGLWRVEGGGAPRVGVYDGGAAVGGPGAEPLPLGALTQAGLAAGRVPAEAAPLRYDADDPWDARILAEAISIDAAAAQLHASVSEQFGAEPRPARFYASFIAADSPLAAALPSLSSNDDERVFGPPADLLVALVVTDALSTGTDMTAAGAVDEVRDLRGQGAAWGLILIRHGLGLAAFDAAVDRALRRRDAVAGEVEPPAGTTGGPSPTPSVVPTGDDGTGTSGDTTTGGDGTTTGTTSGEPTASPEPTDPSPTSSPTPSGSPTPTRSPSPTPSPSPSPSEAPGPCQLDPCETVNETVDDLTDVIDDAVPGAGETIDEVISEVPTIIPESPTPSLLPSLPVLDD